MKDLGIVILSYNHPELTQGCLESLKPYFSPSEIFLFHNGSSAEIRHQFEKSEPLVYHSSIEKNIGYAGGAQKALEEAFKIFNEVLFLTNDTRWLSSNQELLQPLPPQTIGVPKILLRNHEKIDSCGGYCSLQETPHLKHLWTFPDEFAPPTNKGFYYAPGTAFQIHRNTFQLTSGFRKELFMYWEDVLWSLELQLAGTKLHPLTRLTLDHGGRRTTRKDPKYTKLFRENQNLVLQEAQRKLLSR